MSYHIDTGLIKDKFKVDCECPLCEIKKIIEEQLLYEFLNDAVMEDNTRIQVSKLGFCAEHFDMLFSRQNKLSVALQIRSRIDKLMDTLSEIKSTSAAKKQAQFIYDSAKTCVICDYLEESMVKYYKTIAQMYQKEESFRTTLKNTKGFCQTHYAKLLEYSSHAGFKTKDYISALSTVQIDNMCRIAIELQNFCDAHDYRNVGKPMSKDTETALPRTRIKMFGKKSI